jgi:hypothetical protein
MAQPSEDELGRDGFENQWFWRKLSTECPASRQILRSSTGLMSRPA